MRPVLPIAYGKWSCETNQIGGNDEVHHDDHNGSSVIKCPIHVDDTIKKLILNFVHSTVKTVGGDRSNNKEFFSI